MRLLEQPLSGLCVLEPTVHLDARGAFFEAFNARTFAEVTGATAIFVQDNQSISHRGVLRGLHYQVGPHRQGKLVRVAVGRIFDVAVDIRAGSPTFGAWFGLELSAANKRQLFVPEGFAHGFLALEDGSEVMYKTTTYWHGPSERAIRFDDPQIGIRWPEAGGLHLSSKDLAASSLATAPTL